MSYVKIGLNAGRAPICEDLIEREAICEDLIERGPMCDDNLTTSYHNNITT